MAHTLNLFFTRYTGLYSISLLIAWTPRPSSKPQLAARALVTSQNPRHHPRLLFIVYSRSLFNINTFSGCLYFQAASDLESGVDVLSYS